jgi:D-amino-acid dehydrogenase
MKIAIVGAGIIGVTTAWELLCDDHEVDVFDRRGAAAEESSFAPAGLLALEALTPWTVPGLLRADPHAIRLRNPRPPGASDWLSQFKRLNRLESYISNRTRLQRLADASRTRLHDILAARELSCEHAQGRLLLLRDKREHKRIQPALDLLREAGLALREVDADEARRIEPALSTDTALAGAIHLPDDEIGNCRQFALLLKNEAQQHGAQFFFNCDIAPLSRAAPRSLALAAGSDAIAYDAVVICAGAAAAPLLAPLGLRIPLAAVYGYTLTAPMREPLNAPRGAVFDERLRVGITHLGQRVRVSGVAELGGEPGEIGMDDIQPLYQALHDWFPGAAQFSAGEQRWKGARPMLPDGLPVIGASGVPGVWLNLGHGASGWALACGSARALADQVSGQPGGIDLEGLGPERLLR